METPDLTVSLVVVTYQRDAIVIETLRALAPHAHRFLEILVVDNGNSVVLGEFIESMRQPVFRHLPQVSNDGAVGRTHGILVSRGDIVVTLDDDVRLPAPAQMDSLRQFFSINPNSGCVNFKILYETDGSLDLSDWCHPRDPAVYADKLFETNYISEGACALHGNIVRQIGGYPIDLFIGQEGVELAARILDAGYGIYYLPTVTVTHSVASEGRTSGRQYYFNARNIYWIALRAYTWPLAIQTICREWGTLAYFALIRGRLGFFLRGCLDGLRKTGALLGQRRAIRVDTARHIRLLNKFKPTVAKRLSRLARSKTLE
jgi:GT2 family glycosyltransferase